MAAKNSFPPSLSCRAEFGTGFLPPETGVPKGPEVDISAQRAEIGDHHTRKMAAKTAFVLAGLKYLGFGRLGGGGCSPAKPVSKSNSLLTGKITGNFLVFGCFEQDAAIRKPCGQGASRGKRLKNYQGNFAPVTGIKFAISAYRDRSTANFMVDDLDGTRLMGEL